MTSFETVDIRPVLLFDRIEEVEGLSPSDHIVLGDDLEPVDCGALLQNLLVVLATQAKAKAQHVAFTHWDSELALPWMGLLAGFTAGLIAFFLGHQVEALTFTFSLAFAGVLGSHAIVLTFAAIHTKAFYFGSLGKRIKWLILPLHESETDRHLIGLSG